MPLWKTGVQLRLVCDRTVGDSLKDVGVGAGGGLLSKQLLQRL